MNEVKHTVIVDQKVILLRLLSECEVEKLFCELTIKLECGKIVFVRRQTNTTFDELRKQYS